MPFINTVHTLLPEFTYSSEEVAEYFSDWVAKEGSSFQAKALRIFKNVGISTRHTIAPLEILFAKRSFEESNNLYKDKAIQYATQLLKETLQKINLQASDLDCLITTSCTGFMIPSVNSYLIDNLGLKSTIKHLPVTEIGCAGGTAALIYANDYLKAYPQHRVAILTIEFPSNTIQLDDYSWDNVVSTSLFADGLACAILSGNNQSGFEIQAAEMKHYFNRTNMLGYNLTNTGLKMNLQAELPSFIEENLLELLTTFLKVQELQISEVNNFLVHPGGIKILNKIEKILSTHGKNLSLSREVMSQCGNMSSSTILFILNELIKTNKFEGYTELLSFGPGFTAHQLLLKAK